MLVYQDIRNNFILAVTEGRLEIVKQLINSYKLTYSNACSEQYDLLCCAFKKKYTHIAKLLLVNDFKVNNANLRYSDTPLHLAVTNGDNEVVTMLLNKGANVNAKNEYDRTPLYIAIWTKNREMIHTLLYYGADVNVRDRFLKSPLQAAIKIRCIFTVRILMEHGARVKDDPSLLYLAVQQKSEEIIEMILRNGGDVNFRDKYGRTALHIASQRNHILVVTTLLDLGADINITTINNKTPLNFAMKRIRLFFRENDSDSNENDYDNLERGVCSCLKVAEALRRHIIKLKVANLYVSEKNVQSMKNSTGLNKLQVNCEKEIAIMKIEMIHNSNISFYDMLVKDTHFIATYLMNENIQQELKVENYKIKFPSYANFISCNIKKGMQRKELLIKSSKFFHFLFNNILVLPYDCTEKIIYYLNEEDLRTLVDVDFSS